MDTVNGIQLAEAPTLSLILRDLSEYKVGLTRFHPMSRDKSDKMHYIHKFSNNFPTKKF